jgi:hypothetical protein
MINRMMRRNRYSRYAAPVIGVLFFTLSAFATDHPALWNSSGMRIATTADIVRIDFRNKTFRVRGPEFHSRPRQSGNGTVLPGGITIEIEGGRRSIPAKTGESRLSPSFEYSVIITDSTVLMDGGVSLKFEDFKMGDHISVHGVLTGDRLKAVRVSKWPR